MLARRFITANSALLLLVAAFAVPNIGHAADAKAQKTKTFDDWGVQCETSPAKEEKCFITQTQTMKDSGQQLLKTSVGYLGPKGEPTLVAMLPLGIYLPAGAAFKIADGAQVPMVIQSCTAAGCAAAVVLDDAAIKAMKEGKGPMGIGVMPTAGGKTLSMNVSLKGFKAGYESLK